LLNDKHTEQQAAEAEKEINSLSLEYSEVETEIRAKSPSYASLTQPQPLRVK